MVTIEENILNNNELEKLLNPLLDEDKEQILEAITFIGFLNSLIDYKMRFCNYLANGTIEEKIRFNQSFNTNIEKILCSIDISEIDKNFKVLYDFSKNTNYSKEVKIYYLQQAFEQLNFWVRFFQNSKDTDIELFKQQLNNSFSELNTDLKIDNFLIMIDNNLKEDLKIKIDFLNKVKKSLKKYLDDLNSPLNYLTGFMYANIKVIFDKYNFKDLQMD